MTSHVWKSFADLSWSLNDMLQDEILHSDGNERPVFGAATVTRCPVIWLTTGEIVTITMIEFESAKQT